MIMNNAGWNGIKGKLVLDFQEFCDLVVEKCQSSHIEVGTDSEGKYIKIIGDNITRTKLLELDSSKSYLVFLKSTNSVEAAYPHACNVFFYYTDTSSSHVFTNNGEYTYYVTETNASTTTPKYVKSLQIAYYVGTDTIRDFQLYEIY